jgi:conjugative relaxase-like TrwC/TraI family protein
LLTISKLKRWSINYYIDTAQSAEKVSRDLARAAGGLGEYYSERETRTPTWMLVGDTQTTAKMVGLSDVQRVGGEADAEVVARWLDDGVAPNGARGRVSGERSVHGFDLMFAAPKSVSLVRALRADDVVSKAIADAHTTAQSEAMEYLVAHAGYTRVHNPHTGEKDLVGLPGLTAIAYQHETSRCGDPHLHTHVIVPNRQARADGQLVSIDGTSLYHEAKAAGVIYQATLRRELHRSLGMEWAPVDPSSGMAEIAGVGRDSITAWSRRSTQLREWAAHNLSVVDGPLTAAQLAAAQKATRPSKPEELAWTWLLAQWRADARGLQLDRASFEEARAARCASKRTPFDRAGIAEAAAKIDKAAFTRADLVEILGAQLPIDTERTPRELVEAAVDQISVPLTAPRAAHQREGHERFTLDGILHEEAAVLDLVDARDVRAQLWATDEHTAHLSADQRRAVDTIAHSPWLVQPLSAPAGAGKTTSMRALRAARDRCYGRTLVLAPTGKAVDVAVREGAGDAGYTIAKALQLLRANTLELKPNTLVIVDEAAMVGTPDLRELLTATTAAGVKTVLVGDAHQLAPVKARGGMFAQLCTDLPWTQHLSEVWRMRDPEERSASVALRNGGPASVRRAIGWYRTHDRLHCGDQIAMAADALAAYKADIEAGKDALLLCDTTEMADALNQRIHRNTLNQDAPTVTAARGQRIGVGDLIISRRNDATISIYDAAHDIAATDSVRNGNRWRTVAIDTTHNRVAARRLSDGARAIFDEDYLREHITYGYAVTVHSAQGVTADTAHAVLSETTSRPLAYVAMTRGRESNHAYLCERTTEASEYSHNRPDGAHHLRRGDSHTAAKMMRTIIATDGRAQTAHDLAAHTDPERLPAHVAGLLIERRAHVAQLRSAEYRDWRTQELQRHASQDRDINQHHGSRRDQFMDYGLDL